MSILKTFGTILSISALAFFVELPAHAGENPAAGERAHLPARVLEGAELARILQQRLTADPELVGARIETQVREGHVTLVGYVRNSAQRDRAVRHVVETSGVRVLDNRLELSAEI